MFAVDDVDFTRRNRELPPAPQHRILTSASSDRRSHGTQPGKRGTAATGLAMLTRRPRLPYSVGLVGAGIILTLLPFGPKINFTKELIFDSLLPPLIFEACILPSLEPSTSRNPYSPNFGYRRRRTSRSRYCHGNAFRPLAVAQCLGIRVSDCGDIPCLRDCIVPGSRRSRTSNTTDRIGESV